jgi:Fe-S cluster biosynthesis and repair protein YggX
MSNPVNNMSPVVEPLPASTDERKASYWRRFQAVALPEKRMGLFVNSVNGKTFMVMAIAALVLSGFTLVPLLINLVNEPLDIKVYLILSFVGTWLMLFIMMMFEGNRGHWEPTLRFMITTVTLGTILAHVVSVMSITLGFMLILLMYPFLTLLLPRGKSYLFDEGVTIEDAFRYEDAWVAWGTWEGKTATHHVRFLISQGRFEDAKRTIERMHPFEKWSINALIKNILGSERSIERFDMNMKGIAYPSDRVMYKWLNRWKIRAKKRTPSVQILLTGISQEHVKFLDFAKFMGWVSGAAPHKDEWIAAVMGGTPLGLDWCLQRRKEAMNQSIEVSIGDKEDPGSDAAPFDPLSDNAMEFYLKKFFHGPVSLKFSLLELAELMGKARYCTLLGTVDVSAVFGWFVKQEMIKNEEEMVAMAANVRAQIKEEVAVFADVDRGNGQGEENESKAVASTQKPIRKRLV